MKNYKYIFSLVSLTILLVGFVSCNEDETYKPFYDDDEMQISEYIASKEDLSELSALLDYTGLKGLMSFYGTYTFFAPTNEALKAFYAEQGKQSFMDFDKEEITKIVRNHVIGQKMLTTRTGEGSLPDTTFSGSHILVTIESDQGELAYFLNKKAKIIERDIELPNGIIQVVDNVMDIIDYSVIGWVKQQESEFSIFVEAMEKTTVDEVLDKEIGFVIDGVSYRNYFTLWAVPDAAYKAAGINSFDDLVARYNKNGLPITSSKSSLNQYMRYHCVNRLLSLSEFSREATHVVTINERLLQIEIDKEDALFKINREENGNYVGIDNNASNNNATNGFVHILKKPLSEIQFRPVKRVVPVCHHDGIPWQQMINDGKAYRRYNWPSMTLEVIGMDPGAVSGIRFHPEAVVYVDNHLYIYNTPGADLLFSVEPNDNNLIWYEFDMPVLAKGKYDVGVKFKGGIPSRAVVQCFFNGERFGDIFDMREGISGLQTRSVGIIQVDASANNVIRFKELKSGGHFIAELIFTPVD